MRKLGIIGGCGWASTALYYDAINRQVAGRLGGLHSALLALENLDFGPIAEMQHAGQWDKISALTAEAGVRLQKAGAEGIIIASNTMHSTYDAVASAVKVPVMHISDATADVLVADGRTRVALLGTQFAMTGDFLRDRYRSRGIEFTPLSQSWAREVDRIIYEELAAGKVVRDSQRKLKTLITELAKQKVQAVVLGCTELVLAVDVRANVLPVYDTTAIHARAAVDWMLAEEEPARAAA